MANLKIIGILLATVVAIESKRIQQHQKRSTTEDICDSMNPNTTVIQCFCTRSQSHENQVLNANCYLTKNNTDVNDLAWNTFKDIKAVEKLILTNRGNIPIKFIPTAALKRLTKLIHINIKYGDIKEINKNAFANLSHIREITLSDDQIEILHRHAFSNHKHLSTITLDKNKISEINREVFVELPHLEKLYLTNNELTTIHDRAFVHLFNLKHLELDKNKIFSLNGETFSGLKNVERLELSHNSLEVIGDNTFLPLTNLQFLNLDDNNIQMLDEKAFKGLINLKALSLSRNKLTVLDNIKIFEGLNSLMSLSIKSNKMKLFNKEILTPVEGNLLNRLNSMFDFDDNEFSCECKLDWLLELWNKTENTRLRISIENLKCNPNTDLAEKWKKQVDSDKAMDPTFKEDTAAAGQNPDYEYYDDSQLDDNEFSCECKLDWLLELWNKTENTRLRISIENLKCNPNTDLAEKWKKQVDSDKAMDPTFKEDTAAAGQNPDYEYYDDSQLDGKLFYIDVRDLLNCSKKYNLNPVTEAPPKIPLENHYGKQSEAKAINTFKTIEVTSEPNKINSDRTEGYLQNKVSNHGTLDLSLDDIYITNPTTQSINKAESFEKPIKEPYPVSSNIKHEDSQKTYTTSRLATVSAKPTSNDDDADMASDEALPPDGHRHSQRYSDETYAVKHSNGNKNFGCVALIIPILTIYSRLV